MRKTVTIRICALALTVSSIVSFVGCGTNVADPKNSASEITQATNSAPAEVLDATESTPVTTITTEATQAETTTMTPEATELETTAATTEETVPEVTTISTEPVTEPTVPPTTIPSEEVKDELGLTKQQRNSFSMLYYLAITAENIRISKNNRLILEDIYTDLLNDINPGAIDELTQDHLENLRDIIKAYIDISVKRDRLQYIYNQDKAASMRNAVPNPLAVLSMTHSLNWKKLALTAAFTVVDSFNNYKRAEEAADRAFLMSGWELDDQETAAIQKNRERAFDYMVDMVQEYDLDGKLTLNEQAISTFAQICQIESVQQKIRRLESEQETYKLLGNYWLELASCYYDTNQYRKCLDCVDKYNELSTGIYRKDYNYVQILPQAIVAAQNCYFGKSYTSNIERFADELIENTSTEEWSLRYFAAQVYLDLYSRTNEWKYLNKAYNIAYDNVTVLLDEQRSQNAIYLAELQMLEAEEPNYDSMKPDKKKDAKAEYKEEKKRVKAYNAKLKETRETELPPLYEPLVLNCDLLFALAEKMHISYSEKQEIEAILQTETNGVFISKPINDHYSFSAPEYDAYIDFSKDEIIIPVDLLSAGAKVIVEIKDNGKTTVCSDCIVDKVEREDSLVSNFRAYVTSETMNDYVWTQNSKVSVKIVAMDGTEPVIFNFVVSEFKDNKMLSDKVVFIEE